MYGEPSVLFWVPVLVLPPGTGGYDVLCVLVIYRCSIEERRVSVL